ncbi:hypothetical protein OGAPHI_005066 [Ogataea philodendri]|uniref:Uncharacterized protein n=2 Tax=Saccharomycotina TaxID=147537 RepID=A0A9P8T358_9ASCO|nr:uncharacterized protein OGAPHI_005066 [Ogataea philodendri]KAH3663665.1 hypothetical protein OGAPHI_005066 [Ogataea philodendri]
METPESPTFIEDIKLFVKAGNLPKLIDHNLPSDLLSSFSIPQLDLSDLTPAKDQSPPFATASPKNTPLKQQTTEEKA